jgi:hypothetical protein
MEVTSDNLVTSNSMRADRSIYRQLQARPIRDYVCF